MSGGTTVRLRDRMNISAVHSFLVQAAKQVDPQPTASGTEVPMQGQLFKMLQELCDRAPTECNVEIIFCPSEEGATDNDCRTCLQAYVRNPSLANGRAIAERLQGVTTKRSGLGLLFLVKGETATGSHVLVISRFPAEQGVLAQEHADQLYVEFRERVFMKNAKAQERHLSTRRRRWSADLRKAARLTVSSLVPVNSRSTGSASFWRLNSGLRGRSVARGWPPRCEPP